MLLHLWWLETGSKPMERERERERERENFCMLFCQQPGGNAVAAFSWEERGEREKERVFVLCGKLGVCLV